MPASLVEVGGASGRRKDGFLSAWRALAILAPSAILLCILWVGRDTINGFRGSRSSGAMMLAEVEVEVETDDSSCDCPAMVNIPDCGNSAVPFLGGVDVVEYWNFDDESATGVAGKDEWQHRHNGYTFYFASKANLKLFKADKTKYMPKYGGFCTWAVTGEYCSDGYPWAADCLGPSGNWAIWKITHGNLYFFLKESARDLFVEDIDGNIANGDARWSKWFPNEADGDVTYNTQCYSMDSTGTPSGSMAMLNGNNTEESLSLLSSSSALPTV